VLDEEEPCVGYGTTPVPEGRYPVPEEGIDVGYPVPLVVHVGLVVVFTVVVLLVDVSVAIVVALSELEAEPEAVGRVIVKVVGTPPSVIVNVLVSQAWQGVAEMVTVTVVVAAACPAGQVTAP
jgi:hypothetical protein